MEIWIARSWPQVATEEHVMLHQENCEIAWESFVEMSCSGCSNDLSFILRISQWRYHTYLVKSHRQIVACVGLASPHLLELVASTPQGQTIRHDHLYIYKFKLFNINHIKYYQYSHSNQLAKPSPLLQPEAIPKPSSKPSTKL